MYNKSTKNQSNFYFLITLVALVVIVIFAELMFINGHLQRRSHEPQISSYVYRYSVNIDQRRQQQYNDNDIDSYDFTEIAEHNQSLITGPVDAFWQPVRNTRYRFYVYSAFFDARLPKQPLIRIIATTRTQKPDRVFCILNYESLNQTTVTESKLKLIRENWRLKYSAYFLLCPLHFQQTLLPDSVAVKHAEDDFISNLLPIIDNRKFRNNMQNITVCIKPIHYHFSNITKILEFIELNRILNVDHFTFYDHSMSDQVRCILREYQKQNTITLLAWNSKFTSQTEIRTENQFAAFNDCLYRSMYRFTYTMFIDLDEFIVPKFHTTITDLIKFFTNKIQTPRIGSFSFQNAFFYLQWPDDINNQYVRTPAPPASPIDLLTIRKTRRKEKLNPHKQRSKYICRPDLVVEAGNHFIWEFIKRTIPIKVFEVAPKFAISHHYRICEFGGNDCIEKPSLIDRSVWKFKGDLIQAVEKRYIQLQSTCKLPIIF